VVKYKYLEPAYVDTVSIIGADNKHKDIDKIFKVHIRLRYNRKPVRGDKFSSRHGQKGTLSQLYPQVNMPFTESGMTPDIIINPNAFPSRMTIAMLIESMAGKAGAIYGKSVDSTPFNHSEEHTAVDEFGKQLLAAGYNYYGNEPMYSGITGEEFRADVFFGIVYYQRLRHLVLDKYQVRTDGPVNALTHQPVKGRKRGGGIRFGEMERDALLSHGTAYLIKDRLMNCSDIHKTWLCSACGNIHTMVPVVEDFKWKCRFCDSDKYMVTVALPYVTRYLVSELASVNIRTILDLTVKEK